MASMPLLRRTQPTGSHRLSLLRPRFIYIISRANSQINKRCHYGKPHTVRYSLTAFLIFSILVPILLSDVNLLGNKGDLYIEYWIFSVLALIPANIASRKGRSFAIWYIYGLCLFLIAFIHSLCIKDNDIAKTFKGWHKCLYCGEFSRPEATVCRCCGRDLIQPHL